MKIYAAGWALQSPALNYFKKFLKINSSQLSLEGIIYPKKIPDFIEGIQVFDFDDFLESPVIASSKIIECHLQSNKALSDGFHQYFSKNSIQIIKMSDFLDQIIQIDFDNQWMLPFNGISTLDIRNLQSIAPPSFLSGNFLDTESFEVAQALDKALRHSKWDSLMEFDNEETLDEALLDSLLLMQKTGAPHNYRILEAPSIFLNTLLKLKQHPDHRAFKIFITRNISNKVGEQLAFYQQCFKNTLVIEETESSDVDETVYLSDSAEQIFQRITKGLIVRNAVFTMQRSIIDYHALMHLSNHRAFRIALRQPDTQHQHLVASFVA